MTADISAISRLRIGVDGDGVTTLVAFMSCPLRCRYCLNPQTLSKDNPYRSYSAEGLYEELKKDNLYFLATGGGVTFGGGEPLLNAEFINQFRSICGPDWKINLETSLNVRRELLQSVIDNVDSFIVDIKDMNPETYLGYTGADNSKVIRNLEYIADAGRADSCVIRVPRIQGFNDDKAIESSLAMLKAMGYGKFDIFTYKTDIHGKRKRNL